MRVAICEINVKEREREEDQEEMDTQNIK